MRFKNRLLDITFKGLDGGFPANGEFIGPDYLGQRFFRTKYGRKSETFEGGANGDRSDFTLSALQKRGHFKDIKVRDRSVCGTPSIKVVKEFL